MEPLSTALSTLLGKAIAGTAVAAASIGGLAAADVVELPSLPAEAQTPVVEDLPADGEVVSEAAKALRESKTETETGDAAIEETEEEEAETEEAEAKTEDGLADEAGDPNANADFGQTVAGMAQDDELTGQDVAEYARTENPGADARQDGDVRQDADVRQDDGAGQDDEAPQGARPEDAGEQAESRPEAPAAAAANGRP